MEVFRQMGQRLASDAVDVIFLSNDRGRDFYLTRIGRALQLGKIPSEICLKPLYRMPAEWRHSAAQALFYDLDVEMNDASLYRRPESVEKWDRTVKEILSRLNEK